MGRFEDDEHQQESELLGGTRRTAKGTEMLHPSLFVLLTYAESGLDREAHRRVAAHILICEICSDEMERIETEMLPAMENPISLAERLRCQTKKLLGDLLNPSASPVVAMPDSLTESAGMNPRVKRWPLPALLAFSLSLVTAAALLSMLVLSQMRYDKLAQHLVSLTTYKSDGDEWQKAYEAVKRENELLRAHAHPGKQEQIESAHQTDFAPDASRPRGGNKAPEIVHPPDVASPREPLLIPDGNGAVVISNNSVQRILNENNPQSANTGAAHNSRIIQLPPDIADPFLKLEEDSLPSSPATYEALGIISREVKQDRSRTAKNSSLVSLNLQNTAIRSTGPTLRWAPEPGPQSYKVSIYRLKDQAKVGDFKGIKGTEFTLAEGTLIPGQIYYWFVETEPDPRITDTRPTVSPAARFWVLDETSRRKIENIDHLYGPSSFVRAVIYAKYGLYEEALAQVETLDLSNESVKKLLVALRNQLGRK